MSAQIDMQTAEAIHHILRTSSKPLIVILGPTASGKTAFSITLATTLQKEALHPVIINADSRQLYRFMDIGTAKIRPEEREGIPHKLFDVRDPREEVTAAWYRDAAGEEIRRAHAGGNIPLLVGGSMLYISAVTDQLSFAGKSNPGDRKQIEREYDQDEGRTLYATLMEADPETATRFDRRNKPYVVRATEILRDMGKPSRAKRKGATPYDVLFLGMRLPHTVLTKRINERTQQMLQDGWVEEVQTLLQRGYRESDPGMKSHGYREIANALLKNSPLDGLEAIITAKTRQYAKRQMTWWKRDPRIHWMNPPPRT